MYSPATGCLLRVDIIAGQWVASRYGPNLVVTQRVIGTNDEVYRQVLIVSPMLIPALVTAFHLVARLRNPNEFVTVVRRPITALATDG